MNSIINPTPGQTTKWRGIKTTQVPKHETEARTIINRLGQKSISLPRIDDKKRWAGYPGIAGIARQVAEIIPRNLTIYCEPFAGTAKVYQELLKQNRKRFVEYVLNDKSKFVTKWLKKEFPKATVETGDFASCIRGWDSANTMFVIDQPWNRSYYDQGFSTFNRESVEAYDNEVLKLCRKMKGKFIITTRKENKRMLQSGFTNTLIQSEYVVSGKYPRVLITTNLDLRRKK